MKKEFLLGVLIACVSPVSAKELLEIKITSGIRSEQQSVSVPAQITVISREDIESSQAKSISDVLRGRTGFQVSDLRGDGADTNISLRGFSQTAHANVLILVDGRRLNYADTRSPDLSHISLNDVDHIEVIQGSAGTLYGNQAVGGVVNIITRRTGGKILQASAELGSYDRTGMHLRVGDSHANGVSWRVSLDTLNTDGYRENSARDFASINALIDYAYNNGNVFIEMQGVEDDLLLPGALLEAEYDQDRRQINAGFVNDFSNSDMSLLRAGIKHRLSTHWQFEAELTSRETLQNLTQSFRNNASPAGGYGRRNAVSFNPRLIGNYQLDNGNMHWTMGADIESNNYRILIPNAFGATNQSNNQETSAWYVQATVPLTTGLSVTAGARNAKVDNDLWDARSIAVPRKVDDSVTVATLGLNYQATDALRLFARLDENFRFAKVNEITGANGAILKTQTGISYEAGFEWRSQDRYVDVGVYRLDLDDEIYFDPTVGAFGTNVNLDKTRHRGWTASAGMDVTDTLAISANYTYTHAKFLAGGLDGKFISGVSPHIATVRMDYHPWDNWQFAGEYQMISDKYAIGDNTNVRRKASGYGLLNATAKYNKGNWQFKLQGNNLLDKRYAEFITDNGFGRGYQSSPGINILMTASYRMY